MKTYWSNASPSNRVVEEIPQLRVEGDTTIFPVVEEVAVVEKWLVLREEVRVTRRRSAVPRQEEIELRREVLSVESFSGA